MFFFVFYTHILCFAQVLSNIYTIHAHMSTCIYVKLYILYICTHLYIFCYALFDFNFSVSIIYTMLGYYISFITAWQNLVIFLMLTFVLFVHYVIPYENVCVSSKTYSIYPDFNAFAL